MVENKYKHAPTIMLSRNGDEAGEIRNLQSYRCPMEGCTGWRICVKWPDGRHTYFPTMAQYAIATTTSSMKSTRG